jgi:hypothetical protein
MGYSEYARKNQSALRIAFREPPPSAANQREKILSLLREARRRGQAISGDALRFEHNILQAPTRIFELKNDCGYQIETSQDPDTRLATYHLRADPPEGWQPPTDSKRGKSKPLPLLASTEGQ